MTEIRLVVAGARRDGVGKHLGFFPWKKGHVLESDGSGGCLPWNVLAGFGTKTRQFYVL